ncbi:MAG TPA: ArgE/DapE family deacylase [Gemmatimonadaceae bacterium]|nr:ArgE/DapE family deacylase [Gemmatimonadaceae bacterium]
MTRADPLVLARQLVRIDSRNPALAPDSAGETAAAVALAQTLESWGLSVELHEAAPGRPNVVARAGRRSGRSLMLNGHLDVVGVQGMTHAPFAGEEREGRLFGRGAADMKGGLAAMCAAAARAAVRGIDGEVIIAAVADEEHTSLGTRQLLRRGIRADAAIVGEPTSLAIMPAHKGFAWIEIEVRGRAAHGSRYEVGIDAILDAGLVLEELATLERDTLPSRRHPLLGRPSLHVSTIEGGTGWSTYPDRCVIRVERRTLPGERAEEPLAEVHSAIGRAQQRRPPLAAEARQVLSQAPSDVASSAPIVSALSTALIDRNERVTLGGMTAWTDAALLNEAGIPAICFGPGDIALAHAAEEWIGTGEIERATDVLESLIINWCNDGR